MGVRVLTAPGPPGRIARVRRFPRHLPTRGRRPRRRTGAAPAGVLSGPPPPDDGQPVETQSTPTFPPQPLS